jgi:uncharacterized protein with ParB-like and HNH nuclease domain
LGEIEATLEKWKRSPIGKEGDPGLIIPEYQRGYVWTPNQQIAYMEYILKGGESGRDILFNNPSWQAAYDQPTELFDGQQRLGAIKAFLNNEIQCFGSFFKEFDSQVKIRRIYINFKMFSMNNRAELIKTYLAFNTGGSKHTDEDLEPAFKEHKKLDSEND